jgi:lipopolysaccharide transport system permease protein
MQISVPDGHAAVPAGVFQSGWRHRRLILRLTRHEIEARYRGSLLGRLWAVLTPLFMLAMYTFVFVAIFPAKWNDQVYGTANVALLYFVGLILFDFLFESVIRAPMLVGEYASLIKKVPFPVEVIAWVALATAAFRGVVSACILLIFYLVVDGLPPVSALSIPITLAPLALVALGSIWLLAPVGAFVRDVRHLIGLAAPAAMFLTPIFYPLSAVPEPYRYLLYANPLSLAVEDTRRALFEGGWPQWGALAAYSIIAWAFVSGAYWTFMRVKMDLADVA